MRVECIEAVARALGRGLNKQEVQDIESRVSRHMRMQARANRTEWQQMSAAERVTVAGKTAAAELVSEAEKARERTALQIAALGKAAARIADRARSESSHAAAVVRELEDMDSYRKGIEREYFSNLMETLKAASPKWWGFVENMDAVKLFAREVFGESTGNALAAKGAKAWRETAEAMRQRFNRAGGDIRKLAYGYLPQAYNVRMVAKTPALKWAQEQLPRLDRSRYLNDDGSAMNDQGVLAVLGEIHASIATDGLNDLEPGKLQSAAMRAKRGMESRELHFKDAQSYFDYMSTYGRGTLFEVMRGHVGALARDIALVERMGPNSEGTFRFLNDSARKADGAEKLVGPFLVPARNVWEVLSGQTGQTSHAKLARLGQDVRSFTVATKLTGTLLSSFNDVWTTILAANYNRMGIGRTLADVVRGFGSESKEYANRVGLISESMIGDMARFAETNLRETYAGKLANFTMKAGLLNAWTDAIRRGFSVSLMGSIGKLTRTDWSEMAAVDRKRLEHRGIDERMWKIWRRANPEDWRGSTMLTPEAVRAIPDVSLAQFGEPAQVRDEAASRLLGFIIEESEYAVNTTDIYTRAAITRGTKNGTVEGEFMRSLFLFKGFPMSLVSRHLKRINTLEDEGIAAMSTYAVMLLAGLWLAGALSLQAKSIAFGQDPRDMTDKRFWLASFAQGGGFGIYGDVLFTGMGGQGRSGAENWTNLAGPVFGSAFQLGSLTLGNLGQAARGQDTHAAAELLKFGRQALIPTNLWYTRAAFDHMLFHELQENLSPGYLSKMRRRAQREYGATFWWEPGERWPTRAPDLSTAAGE